MDGEPTKKYVPTVLVVDSWAQQKYTTWYNWRSFKYLQEEIANGRYLEQMRPFMLEANIMLFCDDSTLVKNKE